jgi:methyl-accepting chemotaxis protein
MNNWTISKRITFGFAVILTILLAVSIITFQRIKHIHDSFAELSGVGMPTAEHLGNMSAHAREAQGIIYKHIYSPSDQDMKTLEARLDALTRENNADTEALTKNLSSPEEKNLLEKFDKARESYRRIRAEILTASRASTNSEMSGKLAVRSRAELDPAADGYINAIDALKELENRQSAALVKSNAAAVKSAYVVLLSGLGVGLLLGISLAWLITSGTNRVLKTVSHDLNDGADQVSSAATQVSSSSQSLAEGASEQASSLEETSSSLEEMSSMTQHNADKVQKANSLAKEARTAADRGVSDMEAMNAAMEAIKASGDSTAKIVKTIDEIAFQTNILALNAAVEAARAGEAGMGFAVVAEEVRSLAQRSAEAAKETAAKIEESIRNTSQGVELSAKVAASLNDIVVKARQVDELAAEVASASREQTQGIAQINTAVSQMDKVTQSNAASAEESAAAAEELNAQAETMKQSVKQLLKLVSGQTAAGDPPMARPHASPKRSQPAASAPSPAPSLPAARSLSPAPEPAMASKTSRIPMDDDFKSF